MTTTNYRYQGPIRDENTGCLGFRRVVESNVIDGSEGRTYSEVKGNRLVPQSVSQWIGGKKVAETTNSWDRKQSPYGIVFPALKSVEVKQFYGNDTSISMNTDYGYDAYGNQTRRVTTVSGRETRYELTQYYPAETSGSQWLIGQMELRRDSAEDALGENLVGTVKSYRDRSVDALGRVTKREITTKDGVKERVEFRCDNAGRLSRTWEAGNWIDFDHSNPNAVTTTIGKGTAHQLITSAHYDRRFGVVIKEEGVNGQERIFEYDDFGQLSSVFAPDENGASRIVQAFGFVQGTTSNAEGTTVDVRVEQEWTATNWEGTKGFVTETARNAYGRR